jgi:hypothetical protein
VTANNKHALKGKNSRLKYMRITPIGKIDQIHAALVMTECIHNNGKHEAITQNPIRDDIFHTFGPKFKICKNCGVHLPCKN